MNIPTANDQPMVRNLGDFDRASGSVVERALFNHRGWIILLCLLVTSFLGWQATKLQLSASFEKTVPAQHPFIVNFLAHQSELQGLGNAVRIAVANPKGSIYDAKYLDDDGARFEIAPKLTFNLGAGIDWEVNDPLRYKGVWFYQSSYEDAFPRPTVSIFSVNHDPGKAPTYFGYMLISLGFLLIIAELLTGTFYLLVMGIGAFAGAAIAWGGGSFFLQAFGACAVALLGTGVVLYFTPKRAATASDNLLDQGSPVELESWVDASTGLARVKHRGASWEARVVSASRPAPITRPSGLAPSTTPM